MESSRQNLNRFTTTFRASITLIALGLAVFSSAAFADAQNKYSMNSAADVVWAVNFGGQALTTKDGVHYLADTLETDAKKGSISAVSAIKGAQEVDIYQSHRMGEMQIVHSLPDGEYDLTFHFAEPEDVAVGSRVFNVFAEDELIIGGLDVRQARDGSHHAALTHTIPAVKVADGALAIELKSKIGKPIISAIVVRQKLSNPEKWTMIWGDEFNYDGAPDPTKWSYDVWPKGKVNREEQTYTMRPDNVRVENGRLILEAHKEKIDDADYSSGRIHSLGKGDFMYGRAEIMAKLPAGQGTWSALWMLPSDPYKYSSSCEPNEDWQGSETCNAWPNSGEIDIMEHVGYDMNKVHGTVHNKAYYWVNKEQRKASVDGHDVANDFHQYAIEWSPERIDIFFDGSRYFTYLNQGEGWEAWPFDHPYHIVLNLAIGGDWGSAGGPIDNSIFPAKLEVDYVRVYQAVENVSLNN